MGTSPAPRMSRREHGCPFEVWDLPMTAAVLVMEPLFGQQCRRLDAGTVGPQKFVHLVISPRSPRRILVHTNQYCTVTLNRNQLKLAQDDL